MNDNQIKDELNEEDLDLGFDDEDLNDTSDEGKDEGDIEFDYDEEGNIVIPDDSEDGDSEEEADDAPEGADAEGNDAADNGQDENGGAEEAPSTEKPKVVEPAAAPDAKDAEIAKLVNVRRIFKNNVLAGDSDICGAPFDVYYDVGRLYPKVAYALFLVFENELSVFLLDRRAFVARFLKYLVRLLPETSLGERDIYHFFHFKAPFFPYTCPCRRPRVPPLRSCLLRQAA